MHIDQSTALSALAAALRLSQDDHAEILHAKRAVQAGSPVWGLRLSRCLANVCARLNRAGTPVPAEWADTFMVIIGSVDDRGGILPDSDGKTGHIHLRVEMDRKTAYVRAAQCGGESLSEWMTRHCDRESGYHP